MRLLMLADSYQSAAEMAVLKCVQQAVNSMQSGLSRQWPKGVLIRCWMACPAATNTCVSCLPASMDEISAFGSASGARTCLM